jgi:hypothetical protein
LILPASAVCEQETREKFFAPQAGRKIQQRDPADFWETQPARRTGGLVVSLRSRENLSILVAAKKLVALDRGHYAHGTFLAGLSALHAAEAADTHRAGHGDFVGKRQKNLNW